MCFVLLHPFSTCADAYFESSVSYFISFCVLHLSNNALSDPQDLCGSGVELALGVETQLAFRKFAV